MCVLHFNADLQKYTEEEREKDREVGKSEKILLELHKAKEVATLMQFIDYNPIWYNTIWYITV